MTNEKMLRDKIEESGYRLRFLSKKIGISYQCFLNKVTNNSAFKADEIKVLCDLLKITGEEKEKIFFAD